MVQITLTPDERTFQISYPKFFLVVTNGRETNACTATVSIEDVFSTNCPIEIELVIRGQIIADANAIVRVLFGDCILLEQAGPFANNYEVSTNLEIPRCHC